MKVSTLVGLLVLALLPTTHVFAAAAVPAPAGAAVHRDLGRNLGYHRILTLPADLPPAAGARRQPCVLDLRYVHTDAAGAAACHAWIEARATPRLPVFVLANPETGSELITPLLARSGVIVIGRAAVGFSPQIAVQSSAEEERRAYDALAAGTEIAQLITANAGKPRNDEASLSRDRSSEPPAAGRSAANGESPLLDAALQRAVHLHRALLALRKL